jgi:nucleotide-binding universal stress UspA family protein
MFERILVPLDGSKNAEMVLPYAEEIAGKFQGDLALVGVIERDNLPNSTGIKNNDILYAYLAEKAKQVSEQSKGFGIESTDQIYFKLLSGQIAQKILSYSDEIKASLIAMTSRGASSHEKWVLGNISAKILRATNTPVLLVRTGVNETALSEKRLIKKILVPLDQSEIGESAIPIAESLAVKLDAQLVLLHVLTPMTMSGMYDTNPSYLISNSLSNREAETKTYLEKVKESIQARTGVVSSNVVIVGYPAYEISDYSKHHDIDLIALSTHGRSALQQWVFGSVTDKTLHFGDTPVLVVRPSKTKT